MNMLRPCPFCGGEARPEKHVVDSNGKRWIYYAVICGRCKASTGWKSKRVNSITAWNMRAE